MVTNGMDVDMIRNSQNNLKAPQASLRELPGLLDDSAWQKIGLWCIVSILTTGIPASVEAGVQKITSDSIALGFDNLFAQTAPLIWSVAMVAFACHRGWLEEAGVIPSAALILFGGWLGHLFQHGAMVDAVNWLPTDRYALLGSVVFAAINLLIAYVISYGVGAFIASVLVGSVLGVTWSRTLFRLQTRYTHIDSASQSPRANSESNDRKAA